MLCSSADGTSLDFDVELEPFRVGRSVVSDRFREVCCRHRRVLGEQWLCCEQACSCCEQVSSRAQAAPSRLPPPALGSHSCAVYASVCSGHFTEVGSCNTRPLVTGFFTECFQGSRCRSLCQDFFLRAGWCSAVWVEDVWFTRPSDRGHASAPASAVGNRAAVSICVPVLPDLGRGDIPIKTHRKLRISDVENAFPILPLAKVTTERGPPEVRPERSHEPTGTQSGNTKPV